MSLRNGNKARAHRQRLERLKRRRSARLHRRVVELRDSILEYFARREEYADMLYSSHTSDLVKAIEASDNYFHLEGDPN